MSEKKEIIIIGVLIVLLLTLTVGVSYAAFNFSGLGSKVNTITTGAISMTYEETENVISLDKALPTTDKTGKTLEDYFEFTVSGNIKGDTNINYEISAKEQEGNTFDGNNVKLYLTRVTEDGTEEEVMVPELYNEETSSNNFTGRPAGEMSLYTSSMSASESNTYRLRMYVTEEYNPQGDGGNKTFSVKVNVYGKDRVADEVSDVLLANIPKENQYDDGVDTFITGEDPNNYVWYSGKLWRAVSINNESNTTKLVTQWGISAIAYNDDSSAFEESDMEDWLNDITVDGFLGNLREPEKFIVTDAVWDATEDATDLGSITRPNGGTVATDTVGLLNMYEYQSSYTGTTYSNGYLNNSQAWWTLTPSNLDNVYCINLNGSSFDASYFSWYGIRPSINLKSNIKIVDGNGTIDNPYRLEGDNDSNISGTLLNTRYSGEYIRFGNDENNLYRIVSHENGTGTKITSAEPLKNSSAFIKSSFDSNHSDNYSSDTTIGTFLNGEYLTNYVGESYSNMIEDNTTWYLGRMFMNFSYKYTKYTDEDMLEYATTTDAKVGLLRYGELMAGQFDREENNTNYWTLTPLNASVWYIHDYSGSHSVSPSLTTGIKPSLNLKSNVVITGGDGTKNSPFEIELR